MNDLLIYTLSHALGSPSSHRYFSTTCCLPRMAAFRNSSVSTGPNCYKHAETRKHVHTRTNTQIPLEYSSKGNRKGVPPSLDLPLKTSWLYHRHRHGRPWGGLLHGPLPSRTSRWVLCSSQVQHLTENVGGDHPRLGLCSKDKY